MNRPALSDADEYRPDFVGDGHDDAVLLRYKQVADLLGVHPKTVYELPIRRVRISKGRVRWRLSAVREFIDRREGA